MGLEHGMLKMLFSLKTRRVLGVQIVGEGATELIHIAQAVLNLKGTVDYFVQNTFNYPDPCRGLQNRRTGCVQPHAHSRRNTR